MNRVIYWVDTLLTKNLVQQIVLHSKAKYTKNDLEEIDFDEFESPEHGWNLLTPSPVSSEAHLLSEDTEPLISVAYLEF